jgi:hypothetical protein
MDKFGVDSIELGWAGMTTAPCGWASAGLRSVSITPALAWGTPVHDLALQGSHRCLCEQYWGRRQIGQLHRR